MLRKHEADTNVKKERSFVDKKMREFLFQYN